MADDAAGTGTAAAAAAPGEAAPTQQQAPRRVVLFAVGDDDLSERAFAWAVDPSSGGGNLLRDGDAVHLLHVIVAEGGRDLRVMRRHGMEDGGRRGRDVVAAAGTPAQRARTPSPAPCLSISHIQSLPTRP